MIEWYKKLTKKTMKLVGISKDRYMWLTFAKVSLLAYVVVLFFLRYESQGFNAHASMVN